MTAKQLEPIKALAFPSSDDDEKGDEDDEYDEGPASDHDPEAPVGFKPASRSSTIANLISSQRPVMWEAPSQASLEQASKSIRRWQDEFDEPPSTPAATATPLLTKNGRQVLGALENLPKSQGIAPSLLKKIASPAPFRVPFSPSARSIPPIPSSSRPAPASPSQSFARPRLPSLQRPTFQNSPLNPNSIRTPSTPVTPARAMLGLSRSKPTSSASRPRTSFSTPFKPGMGPGESGRLQADLHKQKTKVDAEAAAATEQQRRLAEIRERERKLAVFDLGE